MKQLFKNILDYVKQYPFTFITHIVFLLLTIKMIGLFFDGNHPTKFCLFIAIPFFIYCIVIYCLQKFIKDKNKYLQGTILFFVNCIFLGIFFYVSADQLQPFCKTVKNPDTYINLVDKRCFNTNWKLIGVNSYLDIDNIHYYKDRNEDIHALITLKHFKDKDVDSLNEAVIKNYKKPFHYLYEVSDVNLSQKRINLRYIGFYNNNNKYIHGGTFAMDDPEFTRPWSTNTMIHQYLVDNSSSKF